MNSIEIDVLNILKKNNPKFEISDNTEIEIDHLSDQFSFDDGQGRIYRCSFKINPPILERMTTGKINRVRTHDYYSILIGEYTYNIFMRKEKLTKIQNNLANSRK